MEGPTNQRKGTFAKGAHTILDAYDLPSFWPVIVLWSPTKIMVDLSLQNSNYDPLSQFTELVAHHQDTQFLYTNGSKKAEIVRCAVTSSSLIMQQRVLPSSFSIFSVELQAILLVMQHIAQNSLQCGVKGTDSLSAIHALFSIKETVSSQQLTLKLIWTPSHQGTLGNELADSVVREAAKW